MTSKKIIERLQQLDWYVEYKTEHELALLLNACLDAGVGWYDGGNATEIVDSDPFPAPIGRSSKHRNDNLGFYVGLTDEALKQHQDITDWFFEELRNE
ncbi:MULTISPECIES: hypothetical protein [unclassified Gilliamella]|uniref:hypothetical protein n=1 Tax=unclassified Gilliamella TaxID=2685620 RepID=UPI00132A5CFD|nr:MULTISPECIES: hypothetical protein [unclassified Gilliamella]MWN30978.1 hypothetical protein [Gilliamella sp. Pra-s60]MWP28457.1 hypothetical protein [Gilliamella sp. Pra-s54]